MLSSENTWSKPSRLKEDEVRMFEKKLKEFIDLDGDHQSLLKVYRRWKKNGYLDQFCRENFLNARALKQAENIKVQLGDLVKGTNKKICL